MDLKDKRAMVTGGVGFLGRHLVAELRAKGAPNPLEARSG